MARGLRIQFVEPEWLAGVAVNQWVQIQGSSLNALGVSMAAPRGSGTLPGDKIDAWSGLVLDDVTNRWYCPWNGGHDNYWGNEVDVIDLSDDAPAWSRLEASSVSGNVPAGSNEYYSDGRPASCHSYTSLQLNKTDNRIIRCGTPAPSKEGSPRDACAGFNLSTNQSLAADTIANLPSQPVAQAWVCFRDPATDNLYTIYSYNAHKYTRSSNAWAATGTSTADQPGFECTAGVDRSRGRALIVVAIGGQGDGPPYHFTFSNNAFTSVNHGSPGPAWEGDFYSPAVVYCADIDRYLVKRSEVAGGDVYQIHPTTFVVSALATTGGGSIPASVLGLYTRMAEVPNLPGGKKGVVLCPRGSSNLWFLRTS